MSQSSLRTTRPLRTLAVAAGRRTPPVVTGSAGSAALAGPASATLSTSARPRSIGAALGAPRTTAHPHLVERLGELRHFRPIEFAVAVGVVLERMLDQPFQ